ncbi:MAG: hypothetical protein KME45_33310 [Stenomitos rutilans HA7619-LM2]|jgi:hypothetical protein|nr:hypothetical protein [Stenomitos rutilans HA7619-LM2]
MNRDPFFTKLKRFKKRMYFSSFEFWKGINTDGVPILSKVLGGIAGTSLGALVGSLFGTTGLILGSVIGLLSSAVIEQFLPKLLTSHISRLSEDPTRELTDRLHQRLDEARKQYELKLQQEEHDRANPTREDTVSFIGYDSNQGWYIFELTDGGKAYVLGNLLSLESGILLVGGNRYVLRRTRGSLSGRLLHF